MKWGATLAWLFVNGPVLRTVSAWILKWNAAFKACGWAMTPVSIHLISMLRILKTSPLLISMQPSTAQLVLTWRFILSEGPTSLSALLHRRVSLLPYHTREAVWRRQGQRHIPNVTVWVIKLPSKHLIFKDSVKDTMGSWMQWWEMSQILDVHRCA